MSSSPESLPPGWEGTTTTSPETQPPELEAAIANSPESLPPGFENPIPHPTAPPTPPPPPKPPVSKPSPPPPPPRENQCNLPLRPPPRSPPPPPDCQSHYIPSSPKPLQETQASLPHQQEILDSVPNPRSPPQGNLGCLHPPPLRHHSEMGQMVCGNCNELLSYPRGSKYIQCACCQTVNFVLEAHQVGIVKCGKCTVLLMYPYGAKSLRCSSCHSVTEIGLSASSHSSGSALTELLACAAHRSSPTTSGRPFLCCKGSLLNLKMLHIRRNAITADILQLCTQKE